MRLLLDITPADKESVDRYVLQGRYANLEQFVAVAIRNQLLLEADGAVTSTPTPADERFSAPRAGAGEMSWRLADGADAPVFNVLPAGKKPLPQFVTKLLPTKVVVRVLLNELHKHGREEMPLSEFAPKLIDAAVRLRGELLTVQERNPRARGDQFHPGLPEPETKSTLRFQTYYGPTAPNPDSQSLAMRLGFLATRADAKRDDVIVGLTARGLEFARLPNGVLDDPAKADKAFSDEEQALLVKTIGERSPGDAQLMTWMLEQVMSGTKDRIKLHSAFPKVLRKVVPQATPKVENSFFVATMSRLVELGAVSLEKDGQFTLYRPGLRAKAVAEQMVHP